MWLVWGQWGTFLGEMWGGRIWLFMCVVYFVFLWGKFAICAKLRGSKQGWARKHVYKPLKVNRKRGSPTPALYLLPLTP